MKKKIIIDLDVVTIGLWIKSDSRRQDASKFMQRVESHEFEVIMLSSTLNLVEKWKNTELSKNIKDFYYENTDHFIDDSEILNYLGKHKISSSQIIDSFLEKGIKEEDILLILACIVAEADYLVTFNKTHLKNNSDLINLILKQNNLNKISLVHPMRFNKLIDLSKPFDGIFEYCKLNFISQLNRVHISRYNGFVLFHKAALPSRLFKTFVQEII